MTRPDTRTRILDAAERLFAAEGIAATSLRRVIRAAGVNVAAIHYHFRSRENLLRAVLARRLAPLNAERLRRLDAVETDAGRGPLPLERVIEALVVPLFRLMREAGPGGAAFIRLMGRTLTESSGFLDRLVIEQFGDIIRRFTAAFRRALPALPPRAFYFRIHFLVGAMVYALLETRNLRILSGGACDPLDPDQVVAHLVPFLAAGLRAPIRARRRGGRR